MHVQFPKKNKKTFWHKRQIQLQPLDNNQDYFTNIRGLH